MENIKQSDGLTELEHYKKVLKRIRDWELTSKGSCNILRGFARKALEDAPNNNT